MFTPHITPGFARHLRRGGTLFLAVLMLLLVLLPQGVLAEETTGVVTATSLYIRKTPSTEAEKLRTLEEGWKVTVLGSENGWYKVKYGEIVGYCASEYIDVSGKSASSKKSASSSASGGSIADLGSAPAGSKPGDKNDHVLKLQKALTILGYYDGNLTGNYGEKTEQAVKDFQKAKGLSVDGVAGKGTIKALFGTTASGDSSLKTEKLDWFNGGDSVIPKNAKFEVKDVRTGRTFTARRWSGSNHLDAEPYSKDDTAVIKKNYGGSFSWNRRPVLVKYNGHVYAASMNSMPHGTQTIDNNDYEGHFCIHFYKSKTHETNRIDEDHQAAVAEAMKATW